MTTNFTKIISNLLEKIGAEKSPIRVNDIAKLLSIEIIPYNFPDNFSGVIREIKGHIVIGVNKNHHLNRQRFTIAHEIGHYLLGHSMSHSIGLTNDVIIGEKSAIEIDKEKEANCFAAELLIPKTMLASDIEKFRGKIKIPDLAKMYEVSDQAMSIRLLDTGLINKL